MRKLTFALIAFVPLFVASPSHAQSGANKPLPTIELTIGTRKVTAELARTSEQRATGLMNRFSLQPDHGMLFVFERPEPQGFWMKNTYIPLSIAFIDNDGRILNIDDMAPQTEDTHWSNGPAQYALEVRKGWFKEHGIAAGARVEGLPGRKGRP
jgi:uncharacterized membrane protein (UPF0127 family)